MKTHPFSDLSARFSRRPAAPTDTTSRHETLERLRYYARRVEEIEQRLDELEREWTVSDLFKLEMGSWALIGAAIAAVWRPGAAIAAAAGVLLLQDALTGKCPLRGPFQWAGFRTRAQVEEERYALKGLRGDFSTVPPASTSDLEQAVLRAMDAVAPR
jgi:hypothetical protein